MDGLFEFPQAQLLAAAVAIVVLSVALVIEVSMLVVSFLRRQQAAPASSLPVSSEQDFYDWLYE